jgi:hypothetical protein
MRYDRYAACNIIPGGNSWNRPAPTTTFPKEEKMKKRILLASVLASFFAASAVSAQTGHDAAHGPAPAAEHDAAPAAAAAPMAPGMMGGTMGKGMMHGKMDNQGGMMGGTMGKGMMHGKMDNQGGMMGGKGMCGMMGSGMGSGMMDPGMGTLSPEARQKFLDATTELRKKLNDKQFEYGEAARNPKIDKKELLKKRKELWDVQQKIHGKAWDFMTE